MFNQREHHHTLENLQESQLSEILDKKETNQFKSLNLNNKFSEFNMYINRITSNMENFNQTSKKINQMTNINGNSIKQISKEIEILKTQIIELNKSCGIGYKILDLYKKEYDSAKQFQTKPQTIGEKSKNIEELYEILLDLKSIEIKLNNNTLDRLSVKDFEKIVEICLESESNFNFINSYNSSLVEENKKIKSEIVTNQNDLLIPRICLRCKEQFIQKFNDENSCLYHSDKMLYYSCRSCGDDEYYQCCMKCNKCLIGCKKGKHIYQS